ncbi:hypothetical protein [Campylobacter troglodytis]|uniref:hypothetical protein n=1 Tax=Campylobacter troglodytis TaxID=654363 RepID=UPI001157C8A4|nr:hypothetical protein [Campylobacter troglodytis]TQR60505.1 hypothetical protein DMC01_05435 [Campylobacter troglodytis]
MQLIGSPFYKKAQNDKMGKNSRKFVTSLLKIHTNSSKAVNFLAFFKKIHTNFKHPNANSNKIHTNISQNRLLSHKL